MATKCARPRILTAAAVWMAFGALPPKPLAPFLLSYQPLFLLSYQPLAPFLLSHQPLAPFLLSHQPLAPILLSYQPLVPFFLSYQPLAPFLLSYQPLHALSYQPLAPFLLSYQPFLLSYQINGPLLHIAMNLTTDTTLHTTMTTLRNARSRPGHKQPPSGTWLASYLT
jgi:hypothetical protein